MKLFTQEQERQLKKNGARNSDHIAHDGNTEDVKPVVKLFCPSGAATWLVTEIDPKEPTIAFGLCDLGMGEPEIGSVSLEELSALRGPFGLRVERDRHFEADKTLKAYADEARRLGHIKA